MTTHTTNPVSIEAPQGLPFIDIRREFEAPVSAVFAAHRDPQLLARWLGPAGYEVEHEEFSFTRHGGYRFVNRNAEGQEFWFHGTFHTVREDDLAVQTFEYEGAPDQVSLEFLRFVDLGDGRCRLEAHAVYPSLEARDAMISNGMEHGVRQGYEKLDALLAEGVVSGKAG